LTSNIKVPFVNLSLQFQNDQEEFQKYFNEIGHSGQYIMGPHLELFEKNFASFCNSSYAVGVANATDGLILSMKALDIGLGDEVITATNSFISSVSSIANVGAKPVLVDTCHCYNINPDEIEKKITNKTKAIMPVHLTGKPAEMEKILSLSKKYNLFIIEDAAQAVGAKYKNKKIGSFGDISCFSLHPLKNLNILGDGGIITTNDRSIYERLKLLRNHGLEDRNTCLEWGLNSRLDELQAAFASKRLKQIDKTNERFREIAFSYTQGLKHIVDCPFEADDEYCVYHNFVIKVDNRDKLMSYMLNKFGIQTAIHYPKLIHTQPAASYLGYKEGDFPIAEGMVKRILSLPIYPEINNKQIEYVINSIKSFFDGGINGN